MTPELIASLSLFCFVSSITPGPNNLMLMASGANFGFLRTVPHMLGVGVGFVLMVVIVGAGLAGIFDLYPVSYLILKVVSVVYLLYLAFKIATAAPVRFGRLAAQPDAEGMQSGVGTPISFIQAVLFQWVNPKAWAMALTAMSIFNPTHTLAGVGLVAAVAGVINLPCVSTWAVLGQQVRRWLNSNERLRLFNWTMALLLVLSLAPVLTM
ncbi:MAG: LysE family translocator [Gammaproteobacteria bacterium]|nr:LysE family translocator [Pseudomonadales bacterium]MCP5346513.1 LysE family translocator [Pseudomonadales bacterium]